MYDTVSNVFTDVTTANIADPEKYTVTDKTGMFPAVTDICDLKVDKATKKIFANAAGQKITMTVKEAVYDAADASKVKTKGAISITGYEASKTIKIATAAMKDEDADKSNTIFMYVEGKADAAAAWASGYDATVAKTAASATNPASMMALSTKETTQKILYVAGGNTTTGNEGVIRVSGQASTNPTTPWTSVTDKFDTKMTFVVEPVANKKPVDPNVTAIALTASNGTLSSYTFDAATKTYNITWTGAAQNDTLTFAPTESTGATVTVTSGTNSVLSASGLTLTAGNIRSGDSSAVTVKFENNGKDPVSYTYNISIA